MDYTSWLKFLLLGFRSQDYSLIFGLILAIMLGLRFKILQTVWLLKSVNLLVQLLCQYRISKRKTLKSFSDYVVCNCLLVPEKVEMLDESNDRRCLEDEELDVVTLRKMVKRERARANEAHKELEVERWAADSAAEEALAAILRAQGEKSRIELLAEHDKELIENLKLVVEWNGEEIIRLREELWLCKNKTSDHEEE